MTSSSSSLWGNVDLPPDTHGEWRIGPLQMWIERAEHEWSLATKIVAGGLDESIAYARVDGPATEVPDDAERSRCAVGRGGALHVGPALADRPVVVRAEEPFTLLSGDETTFYVSSPIWLRLCVGDRQWCEFPSLRPSDTWFGPSTREGELCYASRTAARMSLADAPVLPARALTMVRLHNEDDTVLVFERLKIPIGYLGLFAGEDGRLWTHSLQVVRTRESADVDVDSAPPASAGTVALLEGQRQSGPNLLKRTIHALFG